MAPFDAGGAAARGTAASGQAFDFKVSHVDGTIRLRATAERLVAEVHERIAAGASPGTATPPCEAMRLTFVDDEGDAVRLACAADVRDAIAWAAKAGKVSRSVTAV